MKYVAILFFTISLTGYSQRIKVAKGDVNTLKGIRDYNVVFDYSNLEIVNYQSEEVFLKEKMDIRESKVKGSGELFKKKWFRYRKDLYEPSFKMNFNTYFIKKKKIYVNSDNSKSTYTILIKSLKLYPGYNVKMAWESAKLWAEVVIYKTNNPEQIVLRFKPIKIYQGYYDMDLGIRVANAYGVLGRTVAKFLKKKT